MDKHLEKYLHFTRKTLTLFAGSTRWGSGILFLISLILLAVMFTATDPYTLRAFAFLAVYFLVLVLLFGLVGMIFGRTLSLYRRSVAALGLLSCFILWTLKQRVVALGLLTIVGVVFLIYLYRTRRK
jgi:hypothetical protein